MLAVTMLALGQRSVKVGPGNSLRILHVSDTHHSNGECLYVPANSRCTWRNTTQFLNSLVQTERPDLVFFVGRTPGVLCGPNTWCCLWAEHLVFFVGDLITRATPGVLCGRRHRQQLCELQCQG